MRSREVTDAARRSCSSRPIRAGLFLQGGVQLKVSAREGIVAAEIGFQDIEEST